MLIKYEEKSTFLSTFFKAKITTHGFKEQIIGKSSTIENELYNFEGYFI